MSWYHSIHGSPSTDGGELLELFETTRLPSILRLISALGYADKFDPYSPYILAVGADGYIVDLGEYVAKILASIEMEASPRDIIVYARELETRARMVNSGLGEYVVPIVASMTSGNDAVLIMPKISTTLEQILPQLDYHDRLAITDALVAIDTRARQAGIILGDLHPGNVVCDRSAQGEYTVRLLDLAQTVYEIDHYDLQSAEDQLDSTLLMLRRRPR